MVSIINMNSFIMNDADFYGHNDADMLEVGNSGLNSAEQRSHFAFWAAMKSPLIMGTNLTALSEESIAVLQNRYLLSFNQDPVYGAAAKPYKWGTNADWTFNATNPAEYWAGKSQVGTLVLMLNTQVSSRNMTADFSEIPGLQCNHAHEIIDVWTGDNLGRFENNFTTVVGPHDTAVLLLSP